MQEPETLFSPALARQLQDMIAKIDQKPQARKSKEDIYQNRQYRWARQLESLLSRERFDRTNVIDINFALQATVDLASTREEEYELKANKIEAELLSCQPPPCGLIFMGFPGTGKTMLAGILAKLPYPSIPIYSIGEITIEYERGGLDNVDKKFKELYTGDVILDDLGVHDDRKFYGNASIVDEILFQRYRLWKDHKKITIITTNFPYFRKKQNNDEPSGLRDIFGEAISERIEEMCYPIRFVGESKRIPAGKRYCPNRTQNG